MGIYSGVDGVVRQGSAPRVGVNGVAREVPQGFCGVSNIRRQFFGPLEGLVEVEIQVKNFQIYDMDASGIWGDCVYYGSNLAEAKKYGSVTVTDSTIKVSCNTKGKDVYISASVYAVFDNGRKVPVSYLSELTARYGVTGSFPVKYSISYSGSAGSNAGVYRAYVFNQALNNNAYVQNGVSSTKTVSTPWENYNIEISSGVKTSGTVTTQMSFDNIAIDGVTYPVKVVSELIEEEAA